ncbi:hypothetical protein ACELLULO517_13455 [Acidisoma cellulosilytica]|uniref:Uncharacterized protein n=1 Tax=Acidisoma cellulosilyticum TaxID=2802395 RepID=A0A963Z1S5_9PROT|nr:hypothetical protein [Acidisoma cellulosilyticum]MCB8881248.1 hypothetical protein [Acidisoma cellulosilyticum]
MRWLSLATAGLLTVVLAHQAEAATPRSIAALLGASVGYFTAESKICGWNLDEQIHKVYARDFVVIGMTDEQQSDAWAKAKTHEAKLMNLPEKAMTPMKAKICSSADHADLLYTIGE